MLFKLLGLPFSLPAAGVKFCFQQVLNAAEAELMDPAPVKEALLNLQLQLEEEEITEEEYVEAEAVLMVRLREIRAYREQKAKEQLAKLAAQRGRASEPEGPVVEFTSDEPFPTAAFEESDPAESIGAPAR
jgi:hypothetical protein